MYKNSIKSIAIGSFDGIHRGHEALISQVEALVIIERNGGYLTPGYKRSLFVDKICFFYHFEQIKCLSAKEFVDKLKVEFPQLEKIVVGYDFGFGYKKEGNTKRLAELFEGEVQVIDEVKHKAVSVHSRMIKQELKEGHIAEVNGFLNRNYSIDAKVVSGQGLGKKKLVPTLNLNVYDYDLPKNAVYATRTKVGDRWLPSVSFIGIRQTTDSAFAIESHVIDRNIGEVNGKIWVEFVAFIRENRKFESLEALKQQINLDIIQAKKNLN